MKYAVRRYNSITKGLVLIRYSTWFEGVASGFLNGSKGIKNRELLALKTEAVHHKESGEKPPNTWLKRFFLSEKNWRLIGIAVVPSVVLDQRLSIGNLNKERFLIFHLSPLLPKSSLVMGRVVKLSQKEITIINLIPISKQKRWETLPKRNNHNQPYPYFKAKKMGDLHQTDLVGPRHLRGPKGVTRFYSFNTVDVAGHTAFTSQFTDKQTISLCRHLMEAWRFMGVPTGSQMDNEMAATGGGRYPYSLSQVIRLHLLMGIHLAFIPQGEPGRNASVESFNALWQERVLRRHDCHTLTVLKRTSERFLQYYHYGKPHRGLTQKEHGTRFPGILKDRIWKSLRHLPKGFSLDNYMDSNGYLNLPIAKGKLSFIRKVDPHGKIEVNGATYFIKRKLEGQYVIATIFTHRKRLFVKQENKIIKSFSFPIKGHIVVPLLPVTKRET